MNAGGVPKTCKSSGAGLCLSSGGRVSNAWVTYPEEADNLGKPRLIRHVVLSCGVGLKGG
ncbi:hypothetical protein CSW33_09825 [Thermus scotoductus]|uniref:Uncharacterized protein n=1 Tax=Thermus scotoductus TaxID=37636 RepID=A0A430S6N4_THESC|nr:hypothetical protein CSW33_09825 [Thermus scotoductus]